MIEEEGGGRASESLPAVASPREERSLVVWTLFGLAPSMLHAVALMFTSFGQYGAPQGPLGEYVMAMPLFALAYLIVFVLTSARFPTGRPLRRAGFFVGFLLLNMLFWVGGCLTAMGELF